MAIKVNSDNKSIIIEGAIFASVDVNCPETGYLCIASDQYPEEKLGVASPVNYGHFTVPIQNFTVVIEASDLALLTDFRPAAVAALQETKKQVAAAEAKEQAKLDEQIQKLLCLEAPKSES